MKYIFITIIIITTLVQGCSQSNYFYNDSIEYSLNDLHISGNTISFTIQTTNYSNIDSVAITKEQIFIVKKNGKYKAIKTKKGRLEDEEEVIVKKVWKYIE